MNTAARYLATRRASAPSPYAAYARNGATPVAVWDFAGAVYSAAWSVARSTPGSFQQADGSIAIAQPDVARLDYRDGPRSLLIEPAATRVNARPKAASAPWVIEGATATDLTLGALGQFPGIRAASGGQVWHRVGPPRPTLLGGQSYSVTFLYRPGTSGRVRGAVFSSSPSINCGFFGVPGNLSTFQAGGTLSVQSESLMADAVTRRLVLSVTVAANATVSCAIGPDSVTAGQDIIVLACQVETGAVAGSLILSNETVANTGRGADTLVLTAPAGTRDVVFTGATGAETVLSSQALPGIWAPSSPYRSLGMVRVFAAGTQS